MNKNTQGLMNFLLPLFAAAGGYLIFTQEGSMSTQQMLMPTVLVVLYAFFLQLGLTKCPTGQAEYYSDSIYFLGFLYTLMALVTLFIKLNDSLGEDISTRIFGLVGVSVSTSIAGVLLRNMSRAAYMKNHPENEDDMADATARLAEIAASLSRDSAQTLTSIQDFLTERQNNLQIFGDKEERYLQALDRFSSVTDSFCTHLTRQGEALDESISHFTRGSGESLKTIEDMSSTVSTLSREMSRLNKEASSLDLEPLSDSMQILSRDTRELDGVIDSMIGILDQKMEKVPV
ncbi:MULTISPECIES: hypothetical protein [unclassified Oceanispirochaeta]|uniref:hypothetical protein n=1 Tax=unclassified Oceanispirochaeta TaxID=2635722 RepID=UPI000E099C57|nr:MULTISPECIES: hypothetical protein [unclassified Oceanispirochaeta]MBF9018476.1 hypothetical protein [Oceanispirochaeta sp. M2]NPD74882.1 hypothetical protein [Oceanispirochaeta sp. M1]RDG29269.1 hypothetical protein DV872_22555 [Oceanispirochaeta sp. M1]